MLKKIVKICALGFGLGICAGSGSMLGVLTTSKIAEAIEERKEKKSKNYVTVNFDVSEDDKE